MFKIVNFIYFKIIGRFRASFWRLFLKSSGGSLGQNSNLYEGTRINCGRRESIFIGDNFNMLRGATISTHVSGKITIGNNLHLGEYSIISSNKEISIGNDVTIGPHTIIVDLDHQFHKADVPINKQGFRCEKITIKDNVWIAANCSIIKGVTIGKGTVIGAGSVVTHDIPSYSIACGVPAKIIKKRGIIEH